MQNWWENELKDRKILPKLSRDINSEYLVIGAGIAGLHAALYLANKGKKVVLLEKNYCGSSSSGKSSGLLTPTSELDLSQILKKYGTKTARMVWNIPSKGVDEIIANIKKYRIDCDLEKQDCMYLAVNKPGRESVNGEVWAYKKFGLKYRYYDRHSVKEVISSEKYLSGLRTYGNYSINSLLYCDGLKKVLLKKGVRIFENSEVLRTENKIAYTENGSVKAKKIIVCADKVKKKLTKLARKIYHTQTFLTISEPMTQEKIKTLFPKDKLMCWDTRLVYNYFKITKDNRLLLGGGSPFLVYALKLTKSPLIVNMNIRRFRRTFPHLRSLKFVSYWSGLIDVSQDLMPIVDFDENDKDVFYVLGNVGLPWATSMGIYAARLALNEKIAPSENYYKFFHSKRKFFVPDWLQKIIGKIPSFALSNLKAETE